MQVGLAFGDQQAGKDQMKRECETQEEKENPAVMAEIRSQRCRREEGDDEGVAGVNALRALAAWLMCFTT